MYGVTEMSAYCKDDIGWICFVGVSIGCQSIAEVERTTDFAALQGHLLAWYVLEVVDVHVGQGVVVCTVWRTNRCILKMYIFRKSLRWLGLHSKVFVSKRYVFLCIPYCKEAGVVYAWCGGQRVLMK